MQTCYEALGDVRIAACTRLIESSQLSNDNLAGAFNNRGSEYRAKRDYDRAIADFSEAIRLVPNYAKAFNNRGNAYYDRGDDYRGDTRRAIADYNDAIRSNPNYGLAFYNRANAYYRRSERDRAIADLSEAIRLDPTNPDAFHDRGIVYGTQGNTKRAAADHEEAARLGYRPGWRSEDTLPANGVILKERCLMTIEGEYPSKCDWVFVGQAVHVQPFRAERPLSSLAVLLRGNKLRGLIPRDDVLSAKGVTR